MTVQSHILQGGASDAQAAAIADQQANRAAQEAADRAGVRTRVVGGTHRHIVGADQPAPSKGVLGTATDAFRQPVAAGAVTADTIVTVGGIEMRAEQAASPEIGALKLHPSSGLYYDPKQAVPGVEPPKAPSDQEAAQDDKPQDGLPEDHEGRLAEDVERDIATVHRADGDLMADVRTGALNAALSGDGLSLDYDRLGKALGVSPAAAEAKAAATMAAFSAQARDVAKAVGVTDFDGFVEHLRAHNPDGLRNAFLSQFENGRLDGWRVLANSYKAAGHDINENEAFNVEWDVPTQVWRDPQTGRVLIRQGDVVMPYSTAIRTGFIEIDR